MQVTVTETGRFGFDGYFVAELAKEQTLSSGDALPLIYSARPELLLTEAHLEQLVETGWARVGKVASVASAKTEEADDAVAAPEAAVTPSEGSEKAADPVAENKAINPVTSNKAGKKARA